MSMAEFWFMMGAFCGALQNEKIISQLRLKGLSERELEQLKAALKRVVEIAYK